MVSHEWNEKNGFLRGYTDSQQNQLQELKRHTWIITYDSKIAFLQISTLKLYEIGLSHMHNVDKVFVCLI